MVKASGMDFSSVVYCRKNTTERGYPSDKPCSFSLFRVGGGYKIKKVVCPEGAFLIHASLKALLAAIAVECGSYRDGLEVEPETDLPLSLLYQSSSC